ncbi:arylformamidase [Ammoniphilus resinae]|uniref:Kynurenine formamidase n=1 Tax=Ammoniphilus resinae TaxID=861532 RepID=A0ABS4GKS2_9BACL|nr:arylformamidase [Ammoniphilus resinae]MBP1930855.1 arylformamidase [Ammoniphilus resinae]
MKKIIDISQPLDHRTVVWPGDTPFSYDLTWTTQDSGSVNVGQIQMSTHTGTHIDAPFHFNDEGQRVIQLDLDVYVGDALVIHLPKTNSIGPKELDGIDLQGITRLLIRTDAWTDRRVFPSEIPFLEPQLAGYLADRGIRLVGVDLPSVDPLDSKELSAHHQLSAYGIAILEGIVLEHVQPGAYELIALPLALAEADGSPVRAVLRTIRDEKGG